MRNQYHSEISLQINHCIVKKIGNEIMSQLSTCSPMETSWDWSLQIKLENNEKCTALLKSIFIYWFLFANQLERGFPLIRSILYSQVFRHI